MPRKRPDRLVVVMVAVVVAASFVLTAGACSKPRKEKRVSHEIVIPNVPRPHNAEADRLVARAKAEADPKVRAALYEKALAVEPGHLAASAGLTKILADDPASDASRVVEMLARVAGANLSDREAHLSLARARLRLATPDVHGARKAYEHAITLNPGEPEAYRELARTYMSGDAAKPTEAARLLRIAIRVAPRRADIAEELGRALDAAGDRAGAESAYRYAKEKTGDEAPAAPTP
ncbi:MAG: hypothetical protein IT350_17265 [Deltaproteobacteria bacterium]|nr:hypothetical protein [Deltaproteobacteria bacterium]